MESVEYFMVAVAADLVIMVYESVVDIAVRDEFRHDARILHQNGLQPVQLRLLFTIDPDAVAFLQTLADVFGEKFEVLVEDRLGSYVETHRILSLTGQGQFHIYPGKAVQKRIKGLILIHIRRIKPYER